MGMCVRKITVVIFLAVLACLCGCGPMDTVLPLGGTYKLGANVNGMPLSELSFVELNGKIQPYFEEPVSGDPDITALVVFLRNSRGNAVNWKVTYTIEVKDDGKKEEPAAVSSDDPDEDAEEIEKEELNDNQNEDELLSGDEDGLAEAVAEDDKAGEYSGNDYEIFVSVKSLDEELPAFPLPKDLPVGRYTLVSQVMGGKSVLQKTEKSIYYMGNTVFSYSGINAYLPGVTENYQVIPKGTVIMLETALDFDRHLDPYIVWYNGRRKIGEGKFSEGGGNILWKAPDQSGFFSLRAEVFPADNFDGLSGYQKEISLLVSSKTVDLNLVSENSPQVVHWYTFEGGLNDSKMITSAERALKPGAKNSPKWAGAGGTYGLVTGFRNAFLLPKVLVLNNVAETWWMLFRFKPVNEGEILCVQFDASGDVFLRLKTEGRSLVLELSSSIETVSEIYALPERYSLITAEINFVILPEMLFANFSIAGDLINKDELEKEPLGIRAGIGDEFQVLLGTRPESGDAPEAVKKPEITTAIWDELAVYNIPYIVPSMEMIIAEENEVQPENDELSAN